MVKRRSKNRIEPEAYKILETAFYAAAKRLQVDVRELALQYNNDPYQLARAVEGLDWEEDFLEAWEDASRKAHRSSLSAEAKQLALEEIFGEDNVFEKAYIQTHGAERVRLINDNSRKAMRETIARGLDEGIPPGQLAKDIEQFVGLLPQHAKAVHRRRALLIKNGLKGRRLKKEVDKYTKKLLRYRAENIARTELLNAANQGTLDSWNAGMMAGTIPTAAKKIWIVAPDERLCPICAFLSFHKPVGVNDYFVGPSGEKYEAPTAHSSCRCTMGLIY